MPDTTELPALDQGLSLSFQPPLDPQMDQATTEGAQPPLPPPPGPSWQLRSAILQSNYVSGGEYSWLAQYLRSLPHYIDDATRDLGDDLYEQMLLDPQISSGIRLLKEEALANGVRLEPAVRPPDPTDSLNEPGLTADDPINGNIDQQKGDAALAQEITDFCQNCLLSIDRPLIEFLYEMLDGIALGNQVAEKVYTKPVRMGPSNALRIKLKSLKVKPRKATAFCVDAFMNVVGIFGMIPGMAYPVLTGTAIVDPMGNVPNLLPRSKFAVFTWGSKAGDPRGSSLLRPAYNPWYLKRGVMAEYAKYLAQFASPSLMGFTPVGAQPVYPTDALGNIIPGAAPISPERAMLNSLLSFRNGTAAVFSGGSKVEPLQVPSDGSSFRQALMLFDQQITKCILCQTLATESGAHMTRAASQTHQDVLDLVVLHIKALLAAMIKMDILMPLVQINYGDDAAERLVPEVHLAEVLAHNWAKDAAAVAALTTSGYLDSSQFPDLDARLGLPKRSTKVGARPNPPADGQDTGHQSPGGSGGIKPPEATKQGRRAVDFSRQVIPPYSRKRRREIRKALIESLNEAGLLEAAA